MQKTSTLLTTLLGCRITQRAAILALLASLLIAAAGTLALLGTYGWAASLLIAAAWALQPLTRQFIQNNPDK